jgi:KaiC/GvpD/RAD55 family RecA-like ATPase/tetratricopeptide (TPR) repeat protein
LSSKVLAKPAFVGREQELKELESFLSLAIEGKGKTVFISGEAGTGKSRLAREFLSFAKQKGVGVMAGWCLSDAAVPYFPFIEAFNAYFACFEEEQLTSPQQPGVKIGEPAQIGIDGREIVTWLAGPKPLEKMGKPEPLSPQVWKDQAFDHVAKTLLTVSSQGPLVLFLEDIHWADSASLALLHYISRVVNNSERILVLATFRSEEVTTDTEGHPHPLEEEMRMMSREDLFSEIRLSNLNQADVSMIAQNMMGSSVQQELVEKLAKEGNGNPLFLVESLRMLVERKGLVQEDNEWRLAVDDFGIPSKIRDIILRRLAVLKYAQRRVLDAASVIGEEFGVDLLASVLGQDSLDVLETLNFIAHSTSIVSVEEAFYKFDHARSREVLYEALSLPLRRGYHARVAERLEITNKGGKLPVADLAYHFSQADNRDKAVTYSLAAGQEALSRWSNTEAAKHFTYVLQTVGDNPERFVEKTVALEGLGDAFYANNSFNEAAKTFEQLADIQKGAAKLRALRKAMFAAYYQGDLHRLEELTDKAERNATADRLESARVLHQKARVLGVKGHAGASLQLNEEALKVFEEEYALADAAWSLFVVGNLECMAREYAKGIASALRSVALYDELKDFRSQMEAYYYVGLCFGTCRLDQEARDGLAKVIEIDNRLKMANYIELIPAYAFWGLNLQETNDFEDAISKNLKALDYAEKTSSQLYLGLIYENLVRGYTLIGDMASAEQYFEKLMNLPPEFMSTGFGRILFGITRTIYSAGKDQFDESERYFKGFFEFLKAAPTSLYWEIENRRDYAWCLDRQGRFEEAKAQLEQAQQLIDSEHKKFGHVNVVASLMTLTRPTVSQTFNLRLDLVNVSRSHGSIVRVENLLIPELRIVDFPPDCTMRDGFVGFKENKIKPFEVKTIKLTFQATKPGVFYLNPDVIYVDELGKTKTSNPRPFTITVQPARPKYEALPGRITTGLEDLDELLLGGIPEKYAVVLTSPSTDEKELLVKRFLEAGATAGEISFYITTEVANGKAIAEKHPFGFYVFVCNPQTDSMVQNMPNTFGLKGVENLTDIDIALAKVSRSLDSSRTSPRRICIEIISDALLQHHAVTTRRWLSALLPTLKSKGFTILAVVDPQMHPPEELQSVLGVFDGEIRVTEKEIPEGIKQMLRVRKLLNQKYLEKEIVLDKERLSE